MAEVRRIFDGRQDFAQHQLSTTAHLCVLAEPRRLTPGEQAVLDRLVAHAGCAELTTQAASVWVTALCDCGCGSVRLRTDAPPLARPTMQRLSSTGRDDWFSIDYTSFQRPSGHLPALQVVVHVVDGSLQELEIFAGEGVPVDPPPPEELSGITLQ